MEVLRNNLEQLKSEYTISELINAQKSNKIDVERIELSTSFKRLGFAKSDTFKIGEQSFYGDIVVYTEQPKLISTISLMAIHDLMSKGMDRYGVILAIKALIMESTNTEEVIDKIEAFYSSALETIQVA